MSCSYMLQPVTKQREDLGDREAVCIQDRHDAQASQRLSARSFDPELPAHASLLVESDKITISVHSRPDVSTIVCHLVTIQPARSPLSSCSAFDPFTILICIFLSYQYSWSSFFSIGVRSGLLTYCTASSTIVPSLFTGTFTVSTLYLHRNNNMSRITPPVTKLSHAIRGMSSSATRASNVLDQSRHVSIYLPEQSQAWGRNVRTSIKVKWSKLEVITPLKIELNSILTDKWIACWSINCTRSHFFPRLPYATWWSTTHVSSSQTHPLMQGFRTSAPKQAAHDRSTIDFFFFPEVPEPPPTNPFARLRVPLLPDNYSPDRSANSAMLSRLPTMLFHVKRFISLLAILTTFNQL